MSHWKAFPSLGEDIFEHQHGHIAAHSVATAGNGLQLLDHCSVSGRVAVIELHGVSPGEEIRVLAVRQPTRARCGLLHESFLGFGFTRNKQVRSSLNPGVIEADVVGYEVE